MEVSVMSENNVQLKKTLTLPLLIGFGLAYLAPTVVFNYYGIWTTATNGLYPLALIITTVIMTITAYSYTRMCKVYPQAGSAYGYVAKSVNPNLGFLTGWVMLVDYLLLPMICYLLIGIYVNEYFPMIPVWLLIVIVIALGAVINIIGAKVATTVDTIIIIAQLVFTAVTIVLCIKYVLDGGGAGTVFAPSAILDASIFDASAVFTASAVLCVSFVGFDAVTTMAEETKAPEKVMTPAILGVVVGAGVVFTITAYCLQIAWPEAAVLIQDPDTGIYEFYPVIEQPFMADVFFVVDNFASFVCALAGMGAVSRLLYGMGRDNILPKKFFGKLSPKLQTPVNNILLTSVIALTGIFYADNLLGAAELVSFGAILGFIMVNVAVINHYYNRNKMR